MRSFTFVTLLLAALGYAYPQAGGNNGTCATSTYTDYILHTTYVYTYTPVDYEFPSATQTLSPTTVTYTDSSTVTVETITSTSTVCTVEPTGPVSTVYTTAGSSKNKRNDALGARQASPSCTITVTFTTDQGGFAETYVTAPTVTDIIYTNTEQDTVTATISSGTSIAVAYASTTVSADCCTKTLDARCAPSAIISAGGSGGTNNSGFGIEYYEASYGTTYVTSTADAADCCQLCAEADGCSQSIWDSTSNTCTIGFATDGEGDLSCTILYAYYDAGPDRPLAAGAGLWIAPMCGGIQVDQAAPDDGT